LNLLALDTSTEHCSAALWIDGEVDVRESLAGQSHSSLVLGMIDELLKGRGLTVRDLQALAFGEGPGSFTGLRIACGVVQGLAFGARLPVIGIGTLLAMAEGTRADRVVCGVDARVHEIYHAAYERCGREWRAVHEPSVCAPSAAPALPGADWLACGNAFNVYREILLQHYGECVAAVEPDRYPHARDIARLAVVRFTAGETVSAEQAVPVYLRDKVALRTDERASR
jgi:tRNA threonylcarbamoyladenosine biosynthesis protein TsaB